MKNNGSHNIMYLYKKYISIRYTSILQHTSIFVPHLNKIKICDEHSLL